jgi:hypothetical protein
MQGPEHTQWHGIYPLLRTLNEIQHRATELRGEEVGGGDQETDEEGIPSG